MHDDVIIVGAGPAGSVAATVLARAGVRVRLIDRSAFPRDKLCGDTLNPGTLAVLRRLKLDTLTEAQGLPLDGILVTHGAGVAVESRYPRQLAGRAISRRALDWSLVKEAVAAGAAFDERTRVHDALFTDWRGSPGICGVRAGPPGRVSSLRAAVTIAADGRRSTLAFRFGLLGHPIRPRRWAVGAYFEGVRGNSSLGEMHIRAGRYIGIAPLADGVANVCLVKASSAGDAELRAPAALLGRELAADPMLRDRFVGARMIGRPSVLGPLAVDAIAAGVVPDGLLLAGDATGFIDPMTGDGLRFAVRGGELAALAALDALRGGWTGVHAKLAAARRKEFASKWKFNRLVRALVDSPAAVDVATGCARLVPVFIRALVARAGDCDRA